MIRILSSDYRLDASNGIIGESYNSNVGMTEAIAAGIAMLIAYMAVAGRVNSLQVLVMSFFGIFFYSFNETVIWRHAIADNAYTMRIFLFGSGFGLISSFILKINDKEATTDTEKYYATKHTRTFGLIGACFVWIFLPILVSLDEIYDIEGNAT